MASVFQKFGGIRPMATKIKVPPSTVKSWHAKGFIPDWRHDSILGVAKREKIPLTKAELVSISEDADAFSRRGIPTPAEGAADSSPVAVGGGALHAARAIA